MNKAQQNSFVRIHQAIQIIEELAPREQKREAMQRRKKMERAYESLALHAGKLNIAVPELSTFYYPEQHLKHARLVASKIESCMESKPSYDAQQLPLWSTQRSEVEP